MSTLRSTASAPVARDVALALVLALASAACAPEAAAPPDPGLAAADSVVAAWVAEERVPGAVLRVARAGEVVFERAYGWAALYDYGSGQYGGAPGGLVRLEAPRPMTASTVFDLASVTKVMATTFAVMLLVDEGAVDLDAPVSAYLHGFVGGGKDEVTVRHLLTHTSGLRQWVPTYYHAADADAAWAYVRDLPLGWTPGEGRHYSDLGFMTLGRVVERVSGRRLDRFLTERLYAPLGLDRTGFRPAPDAPDAPDAPHAPHAPDRGDAPLAATSHGNPFEYRMVHDPDFGYRIEGDPDAWDGWRRRTLVGEVNDGNAWHAFRGVAGHAGLFSTVADLQVLVDLLLGGGTLDGRAWLSEAVVAAFLAEQVDGQALGWQVPGYAPAGSFVHTGFTGTYVLGVPAQGLSLVLLTNRQNGGVDADHQYPDVGPLQRAVAEAVLGR